MPTASSNAVRTLAVPIRLSLSCQWNRHRLGLTVLRDVHQQSIAPQAAHHTVHHLVTLPQHQTVAAAILDQGELVADAPDDSHHLDATDVGRRVATDVIADESASDQSLERIATSKGVVLIRNAVFEMRA